MHGARAGVKARPCAMTMAIAGSDDRGIITLDDN
jgi:hypothetical protein